MRLHRNSIFILIGLLCYCYFDLVFVPFQIAYFHWKHGDVRWGYVISEVLSNDAYADDFYYTTRSGNTSITTGGSGGPVISTTNGNSTLTTTPTGSIYTNSVGNSSFTTTTGKTTNDDYLIHRDAVDSEDYETYDDDE